MARKKTVSISRKPTAGALPAEAVAPAAMPAAAPEPLAGTAGGSREAPVEPAAGPVGRAVYGVAYCLSYGVVFGVMLVGKLIPGSGLIGRGLRDGGGSARRFFQDEPEPSPFDRPATSAA